MSAMDPEDALDQLLNSTWSNMAQQLSMLHRSLSADIQQQQRERKAEQAQQARLQAAEIKEMEAQRARLLSWESAHRRELNNGFESVLNATVLGTRGCGAVERHKPAESLERQRNARRHGPATPPSSTGRATSWRRNGRSAIPARPSDSRPTAS